MRILRTIDGVIWCLYTPGCDDFINHPVPTAFRVTRGISVAQGFSAMLERADDNLEFLQSDIDSAISVPQLCLEELRCGSLASVGY
jgi:hypothetical protein